MERYHLWFLFLQLLCVLYPLDTREHHVAMVLQEAAEDPSLVVANFARLLKSTDHLLKR